MKSLLSFYGIKFDPFRSNIPTSALRVSPPTESFLRRIEFGLRDGGFALVFGAPGMGKSASLRILDDRLRRNPDVIIGTLTHPQNQVTDFYAELGDIYQVPMGLRRRWDGFKALRARWSEHIRQSRCCPVLIIDEAQDTYLQVFNELRFLSSQEYDSKHILTVILAGDMRLIDRLQSAELAPLNSRIRRKLMLDHASSDDLFVTLEHLLEAAGNTSLMTPELMRALADHAAGNFRVLMHLSDELLTAAFERELPKLDEKLFFETHALLQKSKSGTKRR